MRDFGTMLEKKNDVKYITAALNTAYDVVSGHEHAESLREYCSEENLYCLKIREAIILLHEIATITEMRLLSKHDGAIFNSNRFVFLPGRKSGVYVVHVFEPKV